VPACNTKTLKCTGAAAVAGCTDDASCLGEPVFDSTNEDTCSDGECTCYSGDKHCYRTCARDLDCPTGKVCDTKTTNLCVPDTSCTVDSECIVRSANLNEKCDQTTNTCVLSCMTDRDCQNPFEGEGEPGAFNDQICDPTSNTCISLEADCVDSSQCGAVGGYKTFCVPRVAPTPATSVSSAITN
jgi:hypothetical protein